ncbi:inosose dehydratase [Paraoerskovia sediminicola]|uniref:Inosose dehydratase n=1 Tax=Paraoerskovia sediminicola TaxID=1138587 RepID=A0ABN6XBA2_9CELL|nr:sugar phosphate isomerase/epimerase [Paraoerskovia sediminicola]BDZ42101.1 inosose dehydratase [Paraoerskovia sediminicola]
MRADVAGAPVSFGVFEMTPEGSATVEPDALLEVLVETGYSGVDLGPLGFLGEGAGLARRLSRFGLDLAGGWIQLPLTDDEAFESSLEELDEVLRTFAAATESGPARLPLPTLADLGSPARAASPGRGAEADPLPDDVAQRLYDNLARAAGIVRDVGFEPTFHHHAGTFVESPGEIDAFLEHTDVGLTLDTGHLAIAGGDPVEAVERWGSRINHLHLKDVDRPRLDEILAAGGGMTEVWSGGSFVPFGQGGIDLTRVMTLLDAAAYDGWVVVEQDVLNDPSVDLETFLSECRDAHRVNREALRAWA